jgi:hypothetical protein
MTAAMRTSFAVGAAAALLIAGSVGDAAQYPPGSYPVPTSGWRPGDPGLTALGIGALHGGYRHGRFCVWLTGPGRKRPGPVIWPAGFRVRRHPLELLDAGGAVAARAGEEIQFGGGIAPVRGHDPCMLGQSQAFWVMSEVSAGRNG